MVYERGGCNVMTLSQAAEFLNISAVDIRLRVKQGVLKPLCGSGGTDYRSRELFFNRDDLLSQWTAFMHYDRNIQDQVRYLVTVVQELSKEVSQILRKVQSPEYMTLAQVSEYLGIHRVTLQRRITRLSNSTGQLRLRGARVVLPINFIEGRWMVRAGDLKKAI